MNAKSDRGPSQRQLRVGEEIRHVLAGILARGAARDPDISGTNLTVTEVRVSPDMKNATAFVVPLGGARMGQCVAALNRAAGFLRAQLGREMTLRHVPSLAFEADRSFDEAVRVNQILARPSVRRDLERDADSDPNPRAERDDGA